jgi:hypothetical protein
MKTVMVGRGAWLRRGPQAPPKHFDWAARRRQRHLLGDNGFNVLTLQPAKKDWVFFGLQRSPINGR